MIRRAFLEGVFRDQSPSNTSIHNQVELSDSFLQNNQNLGFEVEDQYRSIHDPELGLFRGLVARAVSLTNSGDFRAPREVHYDHNVMQVIANIQERLSISGMQQPDPFSELNEVLSLFETQPPNHMVRIMENFDPLIPSGRGKFSGTTPIHIIREFSQPAPAQGHGNNSYLPESNSDWSLNQALRNVLSFYDDDFERTVSWENYPPTAIRRNPPRMTVNLTFRDSLESLRTARQQNIVNNIQNYINTTEMDEDEALFLGYAFSRENTTKSIIKREFNIPKLLGRFHKTCPHVVIDGRPEISYSLPVPRRISYQLHSYLTPEQSEATSEESADFTDQHFITPLSQTEFNFHRYTNYLRNLFRRSLLDLPGKYSEIQGTRTDKRSLAFITTLKNILAALKYDEFLQFEEDTLNLARPLDHIIEDTAFYFSNYLLFHLELNQYTRFLKAIIQFSNLENKEDLSI